MKRKQFKPADWQKDPDSLKTERVQLWSLSGTMMGLHPLSVAQDCVKHGTHFVMCEQAFGEMPKAQ